LPHGEIDQVRDADPFDDVERQDRVRDGRAQARLATMAAVLR
jgi:hypothetical protein